MSEILNKLELKLSYSQRGELIMNIILGVWAVIICICFIADVIKIHAVMIALGITALIIAVIDGYFIIAVFYYKNKIKKQKLKEGYVR